MDAIQGRWFSWGDCESRLRSTSCVASAPPFGQLRPPPPLQRPPRSMCTDRRYGTYALIGEKLHLWILWRRDDAFRHRFGTLSPE